MRWMMLAAIGGLLGTGFVAAEEVPVYPGSKLHSDRKVERPRAGSRDISSEWHPVSHERIYTTPATYEQVFTFYKLRFRETDLNLKRTNQKADAGYELNVAYFCLDNAPSIAASGFWLKVQRPLLTGRTRRGYVVKPSQVKDLTAITIVRKWRADYDPRDDGTDGVGAPDKGKKR